MNFILFQITHTFQAPNCIRTLDVTVTKVEHYLKRGLSPETHDQYFRNLYVMYLLAMQAIYCIYLHSL
jgi:hypothetical protein